LENTKNRELGILKEELSRNALEQIEGLKRVQMNNVELYELQIKKLKQNLDTKQHQIESSEHEYKMHTTKLQ
jgi:hypothetical protein